MKQYAKRGRTAADTVQGALGCDPATAQGVVRRLASAMEDADTRAFIMLFCQINGVPLDKLTGERALIHCGKREVGLFLLRCTGARMMDPDLFTIEEITDVSSE